MGKGLRLFALQQRIAQITDLQLQIMGDPPAKFLKQPVRHGQSVDAADDDSDRLVEIVLLHPLQPGKHLLCCGGFRRDHQQRAGCRQHQWQLPIDPVCRYSDEQKIKMALKISQGIDEPLLYAHIEMNEAGQAVASRQLCYLVTGGVEEFMAGVLVLQ